MMWRPIETAPKDGAKFLLARYGWANDTGNLQVGSDEWRKAVWDNSRRVYSLWWVCSGFWSERWQNWNDGIEPSGLADPTHWMPLPEPPDG